MCSFDVGNRNMSLYKKIAKPVLFLTHPDHAHAIISRVGETLGKFYPVRAALAASLVHKDSVLETEVFGIHFKNPVGLAGGFDKNARLTKIIPAVGFGFMEVGSVTRYAYNGNTRPWSVRLKKDHSLIINYGLKNEGADAIYTRLQKNKPSIPLIINIAKTNNPAIKGRGTIEDYVYSYKKMEPLADIVNINISCPNTGDGVLLCEDMGLLKNLLDALQDAYNTSLYKKPMVFKLKPDITDAMLNEILSLIKKYPCVKGFIISNLSQNRGLLAHTSISTIEQYAGGISGKPIRDLSTSLIKKVYTLTKGAYPIIGVGGIFSAQDAYEKICAGASLVELVTGMIYEGPGVIKEINKGLAVLLKKDGFRSIADAVGTGE